MPENEQPRGHMVQMLPWVRIDEPLNLLGFQLVPWKRRGPSIDVNPELLAHVARMCRIYRNLRGRPVEAMTLALRGGDRELELLNGDERARATWVRLALAVASLASRPYFRSGDSYCNTAHFAMYGQGFTDAESIALDMRRRDGATLAAWSIDDLCITCAPHAPPILLCHGEGHAPAEARIDVELLRLVERIARRGGSFARTVRASIDFYLAGNGDAEFETHEHDVPQMVFALECLLRARDSFYGAAEFARAVEDALAIIPDNSWSTAPRWRTLDRTLPYVRDRMLAQLETELNEHQPTIVGLWAFEAYQFRNEHSHGHDLAARAWCWTPAEHALFAAWLYPRLLRCACARELGEDVAELRGETARMAELRLRVRDWNGRDGTATRWDRAEWTVRSEAFRRDLLAAIERDYAADVDDAPAQPPTP